MHAKNNCQEHGIRQFETPCTKDDIRFDLLVNQSTSLACVMPVSAQALRTPGCGIAFFQWLGPFFDALRALQRWGPVNQGM